MKMLVVPNGLYQLSEDPGVAKSETITITISDANPHDMKVLVTPNHVLGSNGTYKSTKLDLDLRKFLLPAGSYVEIVVNLENDDLFFMPGDDETVLDGSTNQYAVTAGSVYAMKILSRILLSKIDPDRKLAKSASFLCEITEHVGNQPLPFNLGLVVRDANDHEYELPVIYDPKVQNDS
ncbi:hypothetical protein [Phenylobacterium sp.]|uniref:hypothetical protein n=1 Tax=Phenylobacterium sp. TaxID=1871053 RepID=UPI00271CC50F|nr:hypothetical protein [Phenylobacterium sp.]MDO8801192.1 hypothetical protein [Phenylobacterium sp.]